MPNSRIRFRTYDSATSSHSLATALACSAGSVGLPVNPRAEGGKPIIAGGRSADRRLRRRLSASPLATSARRDNRPVIRRGDSMRNGYHGDALAANAKVSIEMATRFRPESKFYWSEDVPSVTPGVALHFDQFNGRLVFQTSAGNGGRNTRPCFQA